MARMYKVRPGPKFEVTQEMAIENIRIVYARLGYPPMMTRRLYDLHGSFAARVMDRKWSWIGICQLAGVPCGVRGSKKKERHQCPRCEKREATDFGRYCGNCRKDINRLAQGML